MTLQEAEKLARKHMNIWLDNTWAFDFHNKKRVLGTCDEGIKTIYLSKFYVQAALDEDILNTILHEIAHALAGCANAHNAVWKSACARVGCTPKATSSAKLNYDIMGVKWLCVDPGGKVVKTWLRKPRQSTFEGLKTKYIAGRKEETLGKLRIIPYKS